MASSSPSRAMTLGSSATTKIASPASVALRTLTVWHEEAYAKWKRSLSVEMAWWRSWAQHGAERAKAIGDDSVTVRND